MDENRFRVFYQETAGRLRAYVRRASGDAALAEDIVQEAFLRFLRMGPRHLDDRQRRSYLYRTATSLLMDHWRAATRHRRWQVFAWFERTTPESSGDALDVARIFQELKPREQALLWLAYVEGFDHGEIAQALQLRPGSVRVLLFRARKSMARLVTKHGLQPRPLVGRVKGVTNA